MGDVVSFDACRAWRAERRAVAAAPPSLAEACRGLAAGLSQMRAASLMLAAATAELRDLARDEAHEAVE
jgi:hypothetical protein